MTHLRCMNVTVHLRSLASKYVASVPGGPAWVNFNISTSATHTTIFYVHGVDYELEDDVVLCIFDQENQSRLEQLHPGLLKARSMCKDVA